MEAQQMLRAVPVVPKHTVFIVSVLVGRTIEINQADIRIQQMVSRRVPQLQLIVSRVPLERLGPPGAPLQRPPCGVDRRGSEHGRAMLDDHRVVHQTQLREEKCHVLHLYQQNE